MRTSSGFELSPDCRQALEDAAGRGSGPFARRARVVLLLAEGFSIRAVQDQTGMSPRRILHWRRCWKQAGLSALVDARRPGRPKILTSETENSIWKAVLDAAAYPSTRSIGVRTNVSHTSIMRIWHKAGIRVGEIGRRAFVRQATEIAASVLVSSSRVTIRDRSTGQIASQDLLETARTGVQLHRVEHRHLEAAEIFQSVIVQAQKVGDWRAESRARLNLAYLYLGLGDLTGASTIFRDACSRATATKDQLVHAEALQALGRVLQKQEKFQQASECFESAERQLADLGMASGAVMPRSAAAVGHSLILAHDCVIPAAAIQTAITHFRAKNEVLFGSLKRSPVLRDCGIRRFEAAVLADRMLGADANLGFDLLWQIQARLDRNDQTANDSGVIARCLAESREHFTGGTGLGYHYMLHELVSSYHGARLAKSEDDLGAALDIFVSVALSSGVASVYRRYTDLYSVDQPRRAVHAALAAAALEPKGSNLVEFTFLSRRLADLQGAAKTRSHILDLAERLENLDGKEALPIKTLIANGYGILARSFFEGIKNAIALLSSSPS